MKWAGHVAKTEENRNAYRLLIGRPDGKRPLGSPRSKWLKNIKINLVEMGWVSVYHSGMAQDGHK
jgi:hypothetical protein